VGWRSDLILKQNCSRMGLDKSASNQRRAKYFVVGREYEKIGTEQSDT
jgi:hypothetical protein